ncbi:MAG: phosphoribosyltransferase family protein [Ruminococcus sp.]|nr:phosphoribosyltransferase family protein [Ruminococcus sp.]
MKNLNEIIEIASRYNNKKRSYLLVNKIQAKHIPTKPDEALELFSELGIKIKQSYPDAHLTIGFAETATAIGVVVSAKLGGIYINTTREDYIPESDCICFKEEHSHAVNQKLCIRNIADYIKNISEIVLVDDEISTGKTLYNIIQAMRAEVPELAEIKFVVGSVINRLTPERTAFFEQNNIFFVSLFSVHWTDEMLKRNFSKLYAPSITDESEVIPDFSRIVFPDTRYFTNIFDYIVKCGNIAEQIAESVDFSAFENVLFIGTEECMFPSVCCAKLIAERYNINTFCHSTTRSPICINSAEDYPIKNGFQIASFYDSARVNYIYNIHEYDAVVVISDAKNPYPKALAMLDAVLAKHGIEKRYYFMGE